VDGGAVVSATEAIEPTVTLNAADVAVYAPPVAVKTYL